MWDLLWHFRVGTCCYITEYESSVVSAVSCINHSYCYLYPSSVHVDTFTFITNSCTQLKHFRNFHLKLYTLKMFVMRTKTNLKPYMFRSVRRSSSGVISRALYHYYLSIFLLLRIPVMWRYVFCNIQHPYYSFL